MSEHQQLVEDTLAAIASFPFAISRVRFSPDARISLIALKCYKKPHWNISKMIFLTYKLQKFISLKIHLIAYGVLNLPLVVCSNNTLPIHTKQTISNWNLSQFLRWTSHQNLSYIDPRHTKRGVLKDKKNRRNVSIHFLSASFLFIWGERRRGSFLN